MATKKIKSYSLAEMKDKYIGEVGTIERDEYEYELRMDVLGKMIKSAVGIDRIIKYEINFKKRD